MIGQTISHYKILEKLGEGGMGVVYKAQDTQLQRLVALEFLPPHISGNPEEKARFLHEARSASALNHPNVTTIHAIAESPEGAFLVMEYVEGRTLKDIIENESLSLKKILEIGIQVCEGLNAAHKKEIVHRDIKADNLMVTREGQVKIMDFGLAKLRGASRLTKVGTTLGTAAYMSPEQAQGEEVDQRSDIFSFGVVLYELLTGQLPFKGEHQASLIYSILNEEPQPVARFNNKVTPDLERIVFKALAKDKEERYQHITDLQADLRRERKSLEYLRSGTVTAEVPTAKRKTRVLPIALVAAIALILILGYLFLSGKREPQTVKTAKPSIAVMYLENLSESEEDQYFAAGMTEDIITHLSKIGGLMVASRSDIDQFREKKITIKEVAEKLKVNYVMEGSVRKYGDKIRITCQLIKADDGFHIWAENYDRKLEDVFAIQAEVAKEVAKALKIALAPAEIEQLEKKPTLDVRAYNYYLQGREYYFGGFADPERHKLAIKMFQKALEVDSNYALAYAGLSDCYTSYVMFGIDPKKSWLVEAEKAGKRALKLNPDQAEAHRALSRVYAVQGKMDLAIAEAEEAVKDDPNYAEAWRLLGEWYAGVGRLPEAESCYVKTLDLKPTETSIFSSLINLCSLLGQREKAIEYFRKGTETQPNNTSIYSTMGFVRVGWGELNEAMKLADKILEIDPSDPLGSFGKMQIFLLQSKPDSSLFYLQKARKEFPGADVFLVYALLAEMKKDAEQARVYADSCISYQMSMLKEVKGTPGEYGARLEMAGAWLVKGEKQNAREQVEMVTKALGDSLFTYQWSGLVQSLGYHYTRLREQQMAVECLEFLVSKNILTAAYIRIDPFYKDLAGYPPFEELIKKGN